MSIEENPCNDTTKLEKIKDIELRNVSFKYPNSEEKAIKEISEHFYSGEKIAIVGDNGSGKSTLINLLLGVFRPNNGDILINGHKLQDVLQQYLNLTVCLLQNYVKYQFSAEDNIIIGNGGMQDKTIKNNEALYEIVKRLPRGKMTILGQLDENGIDLSGGEWQQIALLRTFYKKIFDLVILDEPFSNVDPIKSEEILNKIFNDVADKLFIIITHNMLKQCHKELDGSKAVGIDKVTKEEYGKNLDRYIKDLVQRLKNKSFKPLPSLRVYIPKANGKKRPLGIASYEDKIVQMAVKKILGAIYEPRFLNCMYGFRLNRGCHEAIKEVYQRISYGKISYIVDADIKGFFDHIDHGWMMKFLEWNIQDKNLLWLIRKYLKAGIMEQGKFEPTEEGSAQGSVMSPMLANIYMHHVLTLWFKLVVNIQCKSGSKESVNQQVPFQKKMPCLNCIFVYNIIV